MHIRANLFNNASLFRQGLAHLDARFFARHAIELRTGMSDMTCSVHNRWHVQIVALAHGVVIRIVRGSDLDSARTKFRIHVVISDDLQLKIIPEWVIKLVADQICVAFIFRVHGDSNVTQHGLYTGGGYNHVWFIVIERAIAQRY